jgi:hypothetical protein
VFVTQYDIYVKDAVLNAVSPPIFQFVIRSQFVLSLQQSHSFRRYLTPTQRIVIESQLGECEVKEYLKLHLLYIYYIVIPSQLKCLIGAKVLCSRVTGVNTLSNLS